MTSPGPLPESDDPHELLGVPPEADEREIRRAYARRIREYRPETHPREFARIRAAFEAILAGGAAAAPEAGAPRLAGKQEVGEDPRWATIRRAFELLAADRKDEARAALERLSVEAADFAPATIHRFLLEDALGADLPRLAAAVAPGFEAGAPLLPSLFELLDPREQRRLARTDACAWTVLRRQRDRDAAVALLRLRHQEFWLMGEDERVFEEVCSAAFAADALDSPGLTWLAREAATVAAWHRPELVAEMPAAAETTPASGGELLPEDHRAVALAAAPAYRRFWAAERDPPILDRFLRVAPVLDPPALLRLAAELYGQFAAAPERWHERFSALAAIAPDACAHYIRLLAWLLDPEGRLARFELSAVDPDRALRAVAAVEHDLHGFDDRPMALRRLLAGAILETAALPGFLHHVLGAARLRFSARFHREMADAADDLALVAFAWTRLLGTQA